MSQDQYDELKCLAKITGKKLATLVHQAVNEYMSDQTEQTRRAVRLAMRGLDEARALAAIQDMIRGDVIEPDSKDT
jgi:predicted DNA-binding protein